MILLYNSFYTYWLDYFFQSISTKGAIINNEEQKVKDKPKEKKIYLSDNKNDDKQKKSVDYMKKMIVKSALFTYTGERLSGIEYDLFYRYLESRTKPNKSPNSFNLRIERIYNAVVSLYSDFIQDYGDILITTKSMMNQTQTKNVATTNKS